MVPSTLTLSLSPDLRRLIAEHLASGDYRDPAELVAAALQSLARPAQPDEAARRDGVPDRGGSQLEALFTQSAAGMAQVDWSGRFLRANDRYCAIVGRSRDDLLQMRMQDITHPDDRPHNEALFARLAGAGVPFEIEKRYVRPDGSVVWARNAVSALPNGSGVPQTAVGVCVDITERKRAEAALIESERRLNAVLDNATVAVFLMDERQYCVYMNAAAEKLTGYTLAETQGRPLHDVLHHTRPDGTHYPLAECPIDRAYPEHNQMQGEEVFVHKDGSFYPVAFTASPIRDEAAKVVGTIIEVRDIRAQKEAERQQRLLIGELNHRVKNTLATVQSIASQSLRNAGSTEEARAAFEGRLLALSRAHDVLTRESWEGAELHDIVMQAVEPYSNAREDRLHVSGPDVRLSPRTALAIAMALQELATNAVKYGALSNATGQIRMAWALHPASAGLWLHLTWEERGGPPATAPTRRGFGLRLIEHGLANDLGGEVKIAFAPTGLVCTIAAPLSF